MLIWVVCVPWFIIMFCLLLQVWCLELVPFFEAILYNMLVKSNGIIMFDAGSVCNTVWCHGSGKCHDCQTDSLAHDLTWLDSLVSGRAMFMDGKLRNDLVTMFVLGLRFSILMTKILAQHRIRAFHGNLDGLFLRYKSVYHLKTTQPNDSRSQEGSVSYFFLRKSIRW